MITALLLLAGIAVPDPMIALDAVKTCDRAGIRHLINAEPHRRTEFAAAAFAEQRAIAEQRMELLSMPPAPPAPVEVRGGDARSAEARASEAMGNGAALAQLDARQKKLDDARAVEKLWRDLFDEVRADFLANCNGNKQGEH